MNVKRAAKKAGFCPNMSLSFEMMIMTAVLVNQGGLIQARKMAPAYEAQQVRRYNPRATFEPVKLIGDGNQRRCDDWNLEIGKEKCDRDAVSQLLNCALRRSQTRKSYAARNK